LYADVAHDSGILNDWEYTALKARCLEKTSNLRISNMIPTKDESYLYDVVTTIGGFIPYAGILFDVLGNPLPVYAATLDADAIGKIYTPANFEGIISTISRNSNYNATHTIYELYDEVNGVRVVKYVGRTRQKNLNIRKLQHWLDPLKNGLEIQAVSYEGKILENLPYSEARGLEQIMFDKYGGLSVVNGKKVLLNKINPVKNGAAITEKLLLNQTVEGKGATCIKAALKFLGRL
jgi:hypothetical protein